MFIFIAAVTGFCLGGFIGFLAACVLASKRIQSIAEKASATDQAASRRTLAAVYIGSQENSARNGIFSPGSEPSLGFSHETSCITKN
jgi:hypothetical protein